MDLTSLSMVELKKLNGLAVKEIQARQKSELENARAEMLMIARRVGVPLNELVAGLPKNLEKNEKKPVPAVYRNPDNPEQQWSGRGRQPLWVKAWQDKHQSLDGLRI